ncbi:hypothetical protein [Salinibius halmophilus]|uniref:hypothetical protein n=1 Tax=Salinibius halmophilus TaxID=1853216 RepID=UPI000E664BE6|nr:hypothetical protein [Salinibius halmophilus]
MEHWPEPRSKQRKGNYPYKFKIDKDYQYHNTGWQLSQPFDSKWLHISCEGVVTVKANDTGYAWDGCSPKFSVLNLWVLGTPDGHVNYRTMKPYTYYASMVHDALYQYLDSIPVSKYQVDRLFLQMLGDFQLRYPYYWAVRLFGGVRVKQLGLPETPAMS